MQREMYKLQVHLKNYTENGRIYITHKFCRETSCNIGTRLRWDDSIKIDFIEVANVNWDKLALDSVKQWDFCLW